MLLEADHEGPPGAGVVVLVADRAVAVSFPVEDAFLGFFAREFRDFKLFLRHLQIPVQQLQYYEVAVFFRIFHTAGHFLNLFIGYDFLLSVAGAGDADPQIADVVILESASATAAKVAHEGVDMLLHLLVAAGHGDFVLTEVQPDELEAAQVAAAVQAEVGLPREAAALAPHALLKESLFLLGYGGAGEAAEALGLVDVAFLLREALGRERVVALTANFLHCLKV